MLGLGKNCWSRTFVSRRLGYILFSHWVSIQASSLFYKPRSCAAFLLSQEVTVPAQCWRAPKTLAPKFPKSVVFWLRLQPGKGKERKLTSTSLKGLFCSRTGWVHRVLNANPPFVAAEGKGLVLVCDVLALLPPTQSHCHHCTRCEATAMKDYSKIRFLY